MVVDFDEEGKTQAMTRKQQMETRAAPQPSPKGGRNVGPKLGGQGGFVTIGVLTKIATVAAVVIAARTVWKGCNSGSCIRGFADAALDAVGSPANVTEFLEMSPSQQMEFGETLRRDYLFERTGAGWY